MELLSLELRYLRYFVAVAEELNFRRAAERLNVTTPALSVQIKKLEDILGVRLCDRNTARVRLTVAGETFLHQAQGVLTHVQDAVAITRETAQGNRGRLRIGSPGNLSQSFLYKILETYREQFPKVDITLLDLTMEAEQREALEEDRIHVGFVYASELAQMRGVDHLLILDVPPRAVVSARHPLASEKQVTLAQVATYPVLTIQQYKQQTRNLLSVFEEKQLTPKEVHKTNSFNACLAMVVAGQGVAVLPELRIMSQNPNLAVRPIQDAEPRLQRQLHAAWKKNGTSPHVLHFVDVLRQAGVKRD